MNAASARKIPHLTLALILVLGSAQPGAAIAWQDTTKAYRVAYEAEAEYERALRRFAPVWANRGVEGVCDEHVGRFCITYDVGRDRLPPEPPAVTRARKKAIDALEAAFELDPGRRATAYPLVRLLLDGKQMPAAKGVAEEYLRASRDIANGSMLLGLTSHAAADIVGAEQHFAAWLTALLPSERERVTELNWLLNPRERRLYRQMRGAARAEYEKRFWAYADALYLTPGNEIYTEHLARHAESVLLREAPWVMEGTSWGDDVAQLHLRFGAPKARTRRWPSGIGSSELQLIEHWDPEQLTYAAPALDSVLRIQARPGMGWPLDTVRTQSGHAPPTFRRMYALEHQANVFPRDSGRLLRVDGVLPLDSAARGAGAARGLLTALDSSLNVVAAAPAQVRIARDSVFVSGEVRVPMTARFYSLEVLEENSRLAGRARFPIVAARSGSLTISDVAITAPGAETFEPLPSLLLARASAVGIYAELDVPGPRPRNMRVRLRVLHPKNRRHVVAVSWVEEISGDGRAVINNTVELGKLKAGRYLVELAATDQGGASGIATREIVIRSR